MVQNILKYLAIIDELEKNGAQGVILGCTEIGLLIDAMEDSELFVIHALGVHPMYSGKGIAKQMVQKVIDIACENKIKTIRLDVQGGNIPAERTYTKMGFVYCDTIKMFYEDTGWTDYKLYEYIV